MTPDAAPQQEETSHLLYSNGSSSSYDGTTNTDSGESGAEQPPVMNESYLAYVIPMAIGLLLVAMDSTIVVSSYASIGSELNELQSTSWIATAYMLTQTSFQPLSGKLSDIFGRKTCLLTCYVIFTFGCLICGLSTSMTQLIIARAIAGIGGGGMIILVTIILSDVIPLRVRGTWQGALSGAFAVGSTIGAPLGGFFADHVGWRWAFLMQVPLCVMAFFTVLFTLRLPATKNSALFESIKRVDLGGAITLVLSIFFLLFGLDRGGNISWSDQLTIGSLIAFAIFIALFVYVEVRIAPEPFAPTRIVSNFSLLSCYITTFFGAAAALTQIFNISLFYQAVEGKTASEASIWLIICVFGSLAGSVSSGYVMQRTGKYYAITVASYFLVLVGTGIVFLSSGVIVVSTIGLAIGLALTNIGTGSGITTTLIALIAHAGQADQAAATAVSYLFRSLGAVLGISVGSTLVQDTLRYLLGKRLSGENAQEIVKRVRESLSYLNHLDPMTKAIVIQSYKEAMQVTFLFTIAMATLAALFSVFVKERSLTLPSS